MAERKTLNAVPRVAPGAKGAGGGPGSPSVLHATESA